MPFFNMSIMNIIKLLKEWSGGGPARLAPMPIRRLLQRKMEILLCKIVTRMILFHTFSAVTLNVD